MPREGVDYPTEAYRFVNVGHRGASRGQADYEITMMCRVLEVSRSGYYAWLDREPSARAKANAVLLEKIEKIHRESDGTYGAPRVHA